VPDFSAFMFTALAVALLLGILFNVDRYHAIDRKRVPEQVSDAEVRQSILHARQDLKLIAFLLAAILVMLGVIADRVQ
jgi:hypothetical protein